MGVDLRSGSDSGIDESEGAQRPVKVGLPVGLPQRQQLSQGGLIDLDDADTGRFEVGGLVRERQGDLIGRFGQRHVIADEGPREDRHRAGEHTLDRTFRLRRGVRRPFDDDRRGPGGPRPSAEKIRRSSSAATGSRGRPTPPASSYSRSGSRRHRPGPRCGKPPRRCGPAPTRRGCGGHDPNG